MKRYAIIVPLALAMAAAPAVAATPTASPAMAINETNVYVVSVDGMVWGFSCTKKVRETLAKLDGVKDVKVDFASKKATITCKDGSSLSKDSVTTALKAAKFSVAAFDTPKTDKKKDTKKVPASKVYEINVKGMTWGVSCTKKVREALAKADGVEKVDVDFKTKIAKVQMKKAKAMTEKSAKACIEKAGFKVASFKEVVAKKEVEKKEGKGGDTDTLVLAVSGMTWGVGCTKKVRAALASVEGVESVDVDFKGKTASVKMKAGQKVNADAMKEALKKKGYTAKAAEKKGAK